MRPTTALASLLLLLLLPALTLACASPSSSDAPAAEAKPTQDAAAGEAAPTSVDAEPAEEELGEDELGDGAEEGTRRPAPSPSDNSPTTAAPTGGAGFEGEPSRPISGLDIQVPAINGGLDRDIIRRTASDHADDVRSCHGRALAANPGLAGKIVVELTINRKGRVVEAKLGEDSGLANRDVEACVLELVEGWEFDAPSDGKKASAALEFVFDG